MNIPNMLLIGSIVRNCGKTSFCLKFMDKWKKDFEFIGLKITTVRDGEERCHGSGACDACTSFSGCYEVTEETSTQLNKDTSVLLCAGAKRVLWIRTHEQHAQQAFNSIAGALREDCIILCESNMLSEFVTPGATVLMERTDASNVKSSAESFRKKADFACDISKPESVEKALENISVTRENGRVAVSFVDMEGQLIKPSAKAGKST
ncbi:MAG: hypothetical protein FWB75_09900 [Oscillospiraceae bacterium]|nr:hypothetical protein [Oscillospiraceae bacterium]